MRAPRLSGVSVTVPARLHLGFVDLEGGLGRRFGSLGITLEGPYTRLSLSPAAKTEVRGPDSERAHRNLEQLIEHYELAGELELALEEAIPAHRGLGSGTQLALATGMAVCQLYGLPLEPVQLAQLLDRGTRSGIGLGAFLQGGVLLDGGRGESDLPPPIISRFDFPEQWRVMLIYDTALPGVHGEAEIEAFKNLPPFPAESAGRLCRLTLMKALPALAEGEIAEFGAAISEIQSVVGDYFAPAQGGRFASPAVSEVLQWLAQEGIAGVGQSSWGPTGFAIVASAARGERLVAAARERWPTGSGLSFELRAGRNTGASASIKKAVEKAL
ncbi:MAG: GHMP kinase [Rhodospirillales bacterium]|nr:GHMP kinase [Rhodospirillales bacterium]